MQLPPAHDRLTHGRFVSLNPRFLRSLPFLATSLSLALVACGDGGTEPAVPVSVDITTQCSFEAIGQTLSLDAVAKDANGGTVAGVSFSWTSSDPNVVSVSGNVATAVGNGTATLTVTATFEGGTLSATGTCTVQQVATQLGFSTQPAGGKAEEPLSTQPTVEVQDANGNVVTGDNTTVALAIGTNPSAATLGGTTSVAAISGVVSFTDLNIDKAGSGYTLTASTSGLSGATSNAFDIGINVATVEVVPAAVTLASLGEQATLVATARTPSGVKVLGVTFNWVSSDELVVTVSNEGVVTAISGGAGGGPATATITASAEGVSGSSDVTVQQVATQLAFSTQPAGGKAEEPLSTQPTVEVQDALGTKVSGDNTTQVTVAIGDNSCGGMLSGTMTVTAVSGAAAFTDLSIDIECSGYTLIASATGLADDTSASFDIMRNIATIDVTPAAVMLESLGETAQLTAEAKSPSGRVIPGVTFGWSATPTSVCTVDNSGLVTAVGNGTCTVTATADGVDGTATVTVQQKAAGITGSPQFAVLGVLETKTVTVTVVDALDNPIVSPTISSACVDEGVAAVSGTDVTGVTPGVTDCVFTSDMVEDTARIAVVEQSGFATIFTTSQDSYRVTAAPGSTLELDLWMIRPSGGAGDLGSIQGDLLWDPNELTYVNSTVVEGGFTWIPNETNAGTGTLTFAAFSTTGTAATFLLARVTFTVSGVFGGGTALNLSVTAAGDGLGNDITVRVQAVSSAVGIE